MSVAIGDRYGRLTVIARLDRRGHSRYWACQCDCGNMKQVPSGNLLSRGTVSCGCYFREHISRVNATHGETRCKDKSREYTAWAAMVGRCHDPNDVGYKNYGARGIFVCDSWRYSFDNFLAHLLATIGRSPGRGYTLDRIDNDGNYEPGNIRWATYRQQNRNKRNNRILVIDGTAKTMTEWSEIAGLSIGTIHHRVKIGWPDKDAVFTPPMSAR